MNRRIFLKNSARVGIALGGSLVLPQNLLAYPKELKLTILHTNDMHSRIEAFPLTDKKRAGLGGMAARAEIVKRIREEEDNVILLDAGDIFQGTPYFNFYGGELEFKLMSEMGYDVATLGNHDFDAGLDGLKKQLPHAEFEIVNANYNFNNTTLSGLFKPFKIIELSDIRVGIMGIGIELNGLVPDHLIGETLYHEPISVANSIGKQLKFDYHCDIVVCLSHLGYVYESTKVSDLVLGEKTQNIDLIIGGHTHTFLEEPTVVKNQIGQPVLINQVGWAGMHLGRIDFYLGRKNAKKAINFSPEIIQKKTILN